MEADEVTEKAAQIHVEFLDLLETVEENRRSPSVDYCLQLLARYGRI